MSSPAGLPHDRKNWIVAAFTGTRAEYGLLRGTLRAIIADEDMSLRLIVGGTHLSNAHGRTVEEIVGDGLSIDAYVPMSVEINDDSSLVRTMAECTSGVGDALVRLRPDLLVFLGDRYELLPVASVATVLRIPIAHISGGDVTEGAIDNQVRHALTKLAHLHLAGTQEAAARIIQMGERPSCVVVTGEPGLDEFVDQPQQDRHDLAEILGLDATARWVLFTYHPETYAPDGLDEARLNIALDALARRAGVQAILTAANADRGGDVINRHLRRRADADPTKFRFIPSLGHTRFVAAMRHAHAIAGNSSAGIVEAASVPVPAIDIGNRQRGRPAGANVIRIQGDENAMELALDRVEDPDFRASLRGIVNPYGDGNAAARITAALKMFLANPPAAKNFYSIETHGP